MEKYKNIGATQRDGVRVGRERIEHSAFHLF